MEVLGMLNGMDRIKQERVDLVFFFFTFEKN